MKSKQIQQEQLCLQTKMLIDLLRTSLFQIEDFKEFDLWQKRFKSLKSQVNDIYWKL